MARPNVAALGERLERDLLEEWGYAATATVGPRIMVSHQRAN